MNAAIDAFMGEQDWTALEKTNDWKLARDNDNADIVRLTLPAADGERYILRCECTGYPVEAPGVTFVNTVGSKDDPTAWPVGDAEFTERVHPPPHSFLCTSLTREGLTHHPDWRGKEALNAWNGSKHTLMSIFNLVSRLLNGPHYTGRKKV
jgi:hypothetical protein